MFPSLTNTKNSTRLLTAASLTLLAGLLVAQAEPLLAERTTLALAPSAIHPGAIPVQPVQPDAPLPPDAQEVVDQFSRQEAQAMADMQAKLAPHRKELLSQLKTLQDKYTKAGKLDEAVAIRDRIRNLYPFGDLEHPLPAPPSLSTYRGAIGQTFYFKVMGTIQGSVWGSEIYTDDSSLGAAAVHAGVLKPGDEGIVRVTLLPGRDHYDGVGQNGIVSQPYAAFPGSFKIEPADAAAAKTTPLP